MEIQTTRSLRSDTYFLVNFHLSDAVTVYERQVYNLGDFLADVGGMAQIVSALGSYLVAVLSSRLFYATLVKEVFWIRDGNTKANQVKPDNSTTM